MSIRRLYIHATQPLSPDPPVLCESCLRLGGLSLVGEHAIAERNEVAMLTCEGGTCPGLWRLGQPRSSQAPKA